MGALLAHKQPLTHTRLQIAQPAAAGAPQTIHPDPAHTQQCGFVMICIHIYMHGTVLEEYKAMPGVDFQLNLLNLSLFSRLQERRDSKSASDGAGGGQKRQESCEK